MSICTVTEIPTGHVYFARFGNLIKIGYAESVGHRFDAHRKMVPDAVFLFSVRGSRERERLFHQYFRIYRQQSQETSMVRYAEHFSIPDDILDMTRQALSKEIGFVDSETRKDTSKQTIEIDRKVLGRIRALCTRRGVSFQQFAMVALNRELMAAGEPSIDEIKNAAA